MNFVIGASVAASAATLETTTADPSPICAMISLREVSMDGLCVQMTRSGQVFASFGRSLVGRDRDGVLAFAIGKRRFDLLDQLAGGLRTELDRNSLAPASGLIDEIDSECVVERRVHRVVVIDIGGIDRHPPLRSLGAAVAQRRLHHDVGAHGYPLRRVACRRMRKSCSSRPWPGP